MALYVNTLGLSQNGRHFADDILICNFFNENVIILMKLSLNFIPKTLDQIMIILTNDR